MHAHLPPLRVADGFNGFHARHVRSSLVTSALSSQISVDSKAIQNTVAVAQPKYIARRYCPDRGLTMLRGFCDSPNQVMAMPLIAFRIQAGPNGPRALEVESSDQLRNAGPRG